LKATIRESALLDMAQSTITLPSNSTGLLPTVTSNEWGTISLRRRILPSKSRAASTEEPNITNSRWPSVAGVGAA
jgi:hypothetical protein